MCAGLNSLRNYFYVRELTKNISPSTLFNLVFKGVCDYKNGNALVVQIQPRLTKYEKLLAKS